MTMKHEWRKKEKEVYLPKKKPQLVDIEQYNYIIISGEGNPNSEFFSNCIEVLYSVAYAIKMNMKKSEHKPDDYVDFTVYPLEGVWDISDNAKQKNDGKISKDDFVFDLMIRQPNFITEDFFRQMVELTKIKKPNDLLDKVRFEKIKDGKCVQMMHIGSYDDEPASFEIMQKFVDDMSLKRVCKSHREIYLSDFRKVETAKLKTVLRFKVES